MLYSEIAGAVTDFVLNWILIPKMGASGAALGTLVAEFVVLVVQFIVLYKELWGTFKTIKYYKMIVALAAGCAACVLVLFMHFGNFVSLLISAVLFFLCVSGGVVIDEGRAGAANCEAGGWED